MNKDEYNRAKAEALAAVTDNLLRRVPRKGAQVRKANEVRTAERARLVGEARKYRAKGWPVPAIANKLKRHPRTVQKWLNTPDSDR